MLYHVFDVLNCFLDRERMAKKRRVTKVAREAEGDGSSDGEMETPSPKRRKTKEPKTKAKAGGRGKRDSTADQSQKSSAPPSEETPIPFDPNGQYSQPLQQINSLITCSLCEGYLVDATTVIECLHAFCKSCLLRYFEEEDNCCPKCGELIHQSHPTQYISFDRTLQDMVYKLVPGLFEDELKQREDYLKEQRRLAGDDVEEEERKMEEERKRKEREEDCTNRCYEGKPSISHHRSDVQMVIELVRGVDDLPVPPKRFVRASEMCTVTTLKRYLSFAMYGTKSRHNEMDLFCNNELMGRDFSMKFILLTRCRKKPKDEPLRLVYKHKIDF